MAEYAFFAMMARLRWIDRWALMRNSQEENLAEHSLEVAMLSHALCVIGNQRFGKHLNAEKAAVMAMFHDASEILTGDLPTPVKYYSREIRRAYQEIEVSAEGRLLALLPEEMKETYRELFSPGEDLEAEKTLVKGADKLSAYIKCIEERRAGNREFISAEKSTLEALHALNLPEVEVFLDEFVGYYGRTLDEINP
jgi:5'-deoxynucleotidase